MTYCVTSVDLLYLSLVQPPRRTIIVQNGDVNVTARWIEHNVVRIICAFNNVTMFCSNWRNLMIKHLLQ